METNSIFETLVEKIKTGEELSPFLFVWENSLSLNSNIFQITQDLLEHFSLDTQSLFMLPDTGESIKIAEIQQFFSKSYQKPRLAFQIFLIQNFGRITREAANSCLKVLEEPGKWNIIFLTNTTENSLLETILSRVQIIKLSQKYISSGEGFYDSMLDSYILKRDTALISYFFSEKLERSDYADFLEALILYGRKNNLYWDFLEGIENDISWLRYGSLSGKYVLDRYILAL
jgi:DNA polymerase III, delta subunit